MGTYRDVGEVERLDVDFLLRLLHRLVHEVELQDVALLVALLEDLVDEEREQLVDYG